eukprot:1080123-Rhodomonas_salina.1
MQGACGQRVCELLLPGVARERRRRAGVSRRGQEAPRVGCESRPTRVRSHTTRVRSPRGCALVWVGGALLACGVCRALRARRRVHVHTCVARVRTRCVSACNARQDQAQHLVPARASARVGPSTLTQPPVSLPSRALCEQIKAGEGDGAACGGGGGSRISLAASLSGHSTAVSACIPVTL